MFHMGQPWLPHFQHMITIWRQFFGILMSFPWLFATCDRSLKPHHTKMFDSSNRVSIRLPRLNLNHELTICGITGPDCIWHIVCALYGQIIQNICMNMKFFIPKTASLSGFDFMSISKYYLKLALNHWFQILPIYMQIRVLVSSYLFMSGFGHFCFFWNKGDYSPYRFCMVRLMV